MGVGNLWEAVGSDGKRVKQFRTPRPTCSNQGQTVPNTPSEEFESGSNCSEHPVRLVRIGVKQFRTPHPASSNRGPATRNTPSHLFQSPPRLSGRPSQKMATALPNAEHLIRTVGIRVILLRNTSFELLESGSYSSEYPMRPVGIRI